MNRMSARYHTCMDWMDDDNWYVIDKKHDRLILTDKAPEHACESFELYKKVNDFNWNDSPVHIE